MLLSVMFSPCGEFIFWRLPNSERTYVDCRGREPVYVKGQTLHATVVDDGRGGDAAPAGAKNGASLPHVASL